MRALVQIIVLFSWSPLGTIKTKPVESSTQILCASLNSHTVIPLSIRTEKNNNFFLCPKTKGNVFHTVRKFRESLMQIICQKVSIPKYTV